MRLIAVLTGTVVTGMALFEVMMRPSPDERWELGIIFAAMAMLVGVLVRFIPRLAKRLDSIRKTMTLLSIAGFSVVVAGTFAVGSRMFLSQHDLWLLAVVLGFGVLAAIAFAVAVSRPLSADLEALSMGASKVADGDLNGSFAIRRHDEIGHLAVALSRMVGELEQAAAAREADEDARRMFFSSVGHDLRTPLASLRASVEAIQDGVSGSTEESLGIMERDIEALTHLVDDLNLLARLDSGALEVERSLVDVTELADESIDVLKPLANSRKVTLHLAAESRVAAFGHPDHLRRALRNLIDNAIRHAPVSTEVTVGVNRRNGSAVVLVVDQGPGFDRDFAAKAFDRFSRADPSRFRETGGSGLGLAIVKSLITAHEGQVWIEPGPGGRVGIELPSPPANRVSGHPVEKTSST